MAKTDVPVPGTSGHSGSHEISAKNIDRGAKSATQSIEQNVLDALVYKGILSPADLEQATEEAKEEMQDIETLLLNRYQVPKDALGAALSDYFQCPYLPYDERTAIDCSLLKALNIDYLKRNQWLPIARKGRLLDVLTLNPHDIEKGWDVRRSFPGMTIRYAVGLRCDIERFLETAKGQETSSPIHTILSELEEGIPVEPVPIPVSGVLDEHDSVIVRLANHLITEADRLGASDLHIEPYADRKETSVRFRVDGSCFTYMGVPAGYRQALVSRIKIMANLDIAERRKPQDGKIRFKLGPQREIEIRVATLPTGSGNEDAVLRLLTAKEPIPLEAMEFSPDVLSSIKDLSERPHGIILCVGPTGSGKTTTLHAILKHINTDERKIWTAEDPIEITQDGLRQVQVHRKIDLTFATAMRAFLRADPDVIMIGEMRDRETADIAIEASLTGHLVLSTLHTNSAPETIVRLLDLGCDPFNFADAMLGVLATRLCKRICSKCQESYHPSRDEFEELVLGYGASCRKPLEVKYHDELRLSRGRGCETCLRTGFKGRVPLHEWLVGSEGIKQLIQSKACASDVLAKAISEGMVTLLQDGIRKVLSGLTTYRQVRTVATR
jgi:type II secretory ATPase GspE/PulE/Tfp pilus assembly ATPase PilB-like protein